MVWQNLRLWPAHQCLRPKQSKRFVIFGLSSVDESRRWVAIFNMGKHLHTATRKQTAKPARETPYLLNFLRFAAKTPANLLNQSVPLPLPRAEENQLPPHLRNLQVQPEENSSRLLQDETSALIPMSDTNQIIHKQWQQERSAAEDPKFMSSNGASCCSAYPLLSSTCSLPISQPPHVLGGVAMIDSETSHNKQSF